MYMALNYFIGVFLLIIEQAQSVHIQGSAEAQFEKWFKQKTHTLITELKEKETYLKTILKNEINLAQEKIDSAIHPAIEQLKSQKEIIGIECFTNGVEKLELTKKATFWEFVHCSNLTEAIGDVGKIVDKTFNITITIMEYLNTALTGLVKCKLGNWFDDIECVTSYIWNVIDDIRYSIPEVKTYGEDMEILSKEIKDDVNYCLDPPTGNISDKVQKIMNEVSKCARKTK